jgi:hypothetical protein
MPFSATALAWASSPSRAAWARSYGCKYEVSPVSRNPRLPVSMSTMSVRSCSEWSASLRSCCTSRSNLRSTSSWAAFARYRPTPSTATTSRELRRIRQKRALARMRTGRYRDCGTPPGAALLFG